MSYSHPFYVQSLKEFGEPRELPNCGGWILERKIQGTSYRDAMGCYPLFACRKWEKLHEDLEAIGFDLLSLTLVTDPISGVEPTFLEQCFDIVKPFKKHYVVDLSNHLEGCVSKSHLYHARRSLKQMEVEVCLEPIKYLDDWVKLYKELIQRHAIRDIRGFSYKCFEIQLQIPGTIVVIGKHADQVVGAALILVQDDVAYGHLTAFSPIGYRIKASYGITWTSLRYLQDHGIRLFNMGAGAGIQEDDQNGLSKFKAGWSTGTRTAYFCGRIFDSERYSAIVQARGITATDYFPAYRKGEFG